MVEQGRALINQGMLWSNFEGKIHMRFLVPNGNDISNYNSMKRIILSSISLKLIWNIFIKTNRASQKKKKKVHFDLWLRKPIKPISTFRSSPATLRSSRGRWIDTLTEPSMIMKVKSRPDLPPLSAVYVGQQPSPKLPSWRWRILCLPA